MRGTNSETCRTAVTYVRQLSRLARRTGYPPSRQIELFKLVSEVEAAAKEVRQLAEAADARRDASQPRLFS